MSSDRPKSCLRLDTPRVESALKALNPPNTASVVLHCKTCRGQIVITINEKGSVETANHTPYCRLREVLGK